MANSAIVTEAIENSSAGSLDAIQTLLNAIQTENNTEISSLTAEGQAHIAEGFEAHGATVQDTFYRSASPAPYTKPSPIAGQYVVGIPTTAGIIYVPASLSPAGVSSTTT